MRIILYGKIYFYKVVWMQILTLKVFHTLTVRIEVVLSSRPLSHWSSDPNELDTLTPGHFLIDRPMIATPETEVNKIPLNLLQRCQQINSITQQIWNR